MQPRHKAPTVNTTYNMSTVHDIVYKYLQVIQAKPLLNQVVMRINAKIYFQYSTNWQIGLENPIFFMYEPQEQWRKWNLIQIMDYHLKISPNNKLVDVYYYFPYVFLLAKYFRYALYILILTDFFHIS